MFRANIKITLLITWNTFRIVVLFKELEYLQDLWKSFQVRSYKTSTVLDWNPLSSFSLEPIEVKRISAKSHSATEIGYDWNYQFDGQMQIYLHLGPWSCGVEIDAAASGDESERNWHLNTKWRVDYSAQHEEMLRFFLNLAHFWPAF